ncbi:HAMP domain-containing methyl-accepting chemotaxis protein [Arhodomonas aquaeolei]|uniref:HAMP domain-containing methyl-accepting chemotaxis protein n=1 Tax=Arhodomonas aquaeolei TaxID=2369 RepID=UPI00146D4C19|nr:methyl-accepting chemotaxis protein [Arhodomonas aquaeolei]
MKQSKRSEATERGATRKGLRNRRMGLTAKVMAAPALILALFVIVGVVAVNGFRSVDSQMTDVTETLVPNTAVATDMLSSLYRQRLRLDAYIASRDPQMAKEFSQFGSEFDAAVKRAQGLIENAERQDLVDQLAEQHGRYEKVFETKIEQAATGINEIAAKLGDTASGINAPLQELAKAGTGSNDYLLAYQAQSTLGLFNQLRATTRQYVNNQDPALKQETNQLAEETAKGIERLSTYVLGDHQEELVKQARDGLTEYHETAKGLASRLNAIGTARDNTLDPLGKSMAKAARALQDSTFDDLADVAKGAQGRAQQASLVTSGVLAAAVIGGLLLALLITRGIVRPIKRGQEQITGLLTSMENGDADLSRRLDAGKNDEVGEFIAAVNGFLGALQGVVRGIKQETTSLASASEELTAVTQSTDEGVQRQRSEIDQVATAMNEMAATAQEIARNTAEAAKSAESVSDEGERGRKVVQDTVEAIDGLASEVESAAQKVMALRDEAGNISTVLDVIREVAEQTNLLALNAAIEAARAGEQGRGFAVVAEEVRTLAQRTQESTGEIQSIIERVQNGAEDAATAMDSSRSRAQETVDKAAEAGDSFSSISKGINQMTEMNTQIAGAAEEQTATSESINQSVSQVGSVVEESVNAMDQLKSAGEELAAMSNRLRELVGRFRGE